MPELSTDQLSKELHPLNIDQDQSQLVKDSRVFQVAEQDGFTQSDVENLFSKHSLGVFNIFEFAYGLRNSELEPYPEIRRWLKSGHRPAILGLGAAQMDEMYEFAGKFFAGDVWQNAYHTLGIDLDDLQHTQAFMTKLTNEVNKYKPILFFIPENFQRQHYAAMGPSEPGQYPFSVTYREFLFFLKKPELAKHVAFIFGGTTYLDKMYKIHGPSEEDTRYRRYFDKFKKILGVFDKEQK